MADPSPDFLKIVRVLVEHDVDFVIVGGVCAVLQGVPVTTADLDIVHRRTDDNVTKLLAALGALDAKSRLDSRGLKPGRSRLLSAGHQLLTTNAGLLDVLGELVGEYRYEDLLPDSEEVELEGHSIRLLSLEQLLETKTKAGRPKDLAALPLIRNTLEEKRRRG